VLIVLNADDFGASEQTVRATIECFERGALTSATIMPGMPASDAALEYAVAHPELDFGVHLMFVTDGVERPLSDREAIPSLIGPDGRFLPTRTIRARALIGRLRGAEIERELAAQLEHVRDRGVSISHVDSHRHVHKLRPFRVALARVLPRFGILRVRNAQDVFLRRPLRSPTFWWGGVWRRDLMCRFMTTHHFYMPSSTYDVAWSDALVARMHALNGTCEVGVHPGYEDWRDHERVDVQAFAERARREGHSLISWSEVA
jgi:predicted glycoside hydrolase/deacetylase ChbG (UPF0249 family)